MIYEVGKYYRVPTVVASIEGRRRRWPIIGPWHEDIEHIGVEGKHWHIDWRFVPQRLADQIGPYPHGVVIFEQAQPEAVEYHRLKCKRIAIFPFKRKRFDESRSQVTTFEQLHPAFEASRLSEHKHCPHQGADISSVAPVCGIIVCPLHGLCFDAVTGKNISPDVAIERIGIDAVVGNRRQ